MEIPDPDTQRPFVRHMFRFGSGMTGPVVMSGANFLISAMLVAYLPPAEFGLFAFVNVIVGFGSSISNAIFGSVLALRLNQPGTRPGFATALARVNIVFSLAMALFTWLAAELLGEPHLQAELFGVLVFVALIRWFARTRGYADHRVHKVTLSDTLYGGTVILGCATMLVLKDVSVAVALAFLIAGNLAALMLVAERRQAPDNRMGLIDSFRQFGESWQSISRWSFSSVVASEVAYNAHAYMVTVFFGPPAFAPLALAALFWRPSAVAMSTLIQMEVPVLARLAATEDRPTLSKALRHLRIALSAVALANLAAIAVVIWGFAEAWLHEKYSLDEVAAATGLVTLIIFARIARAPDSALLQSTGGFRRLAIAESIAAVVTVLAAAAIIAYAGPVGSLVGVLAGEIVSTALIIRAARAWKRPVVPVIQP